MNSILMAIANDGTFFSIFDKQKDLDNIKKDNPIFFNHANITNEYSFTSNPDRNLEDDEWFYVDFNSISFIDDLDLDNLFNVFNSTASYTNLNKSNLKELRNMFYGFNHNGKEIINIQNIRNSNFIKSNSLLWFLDNGTTYQQTDNTLVFYDRIDVFINKNDGKIYFKNFNELKNFNKKFIEIYRDANDTEIGTFQCSINKEINIFSMQLKRNKKGAFKDIGMRNRKKIKYAIDNHSLNKFKNKNKEVEDYINKYQVPLNKDQNGKFIIQDNTDLTNLVKIINEYHYMGDITQQHLLASGNEEVKQA